eukprot:tig00000204_g17720.t1
MAESFIGRGQGRTVDAILSFLRANPPPQASHNAFANQNVELKPRDLVYVLQRAAAMAGAACTCAAAAGADVLPAAGAPGSFLDLVCAVQSVLIHIDVDYSKKPGSREMIEFARAGGFEECLRLVCRDHPLVRLGEEIAARSGAADHDDICIEDSKLHADILVAQASLVVNVLLLVEGRAREFWEMILSGDRARTSKALLDTLQAAWRPRNPRFPLTARIISNLMNLCTSIPTSFNETFAIFDGPRLDLLLEILHTTVTVRPTAMESSDLELIFEPVAGDGPKGARIVAASRVNQTCVAIACVTLVRKILAGSSGHGEGPEHPGFVNRLRRLIPRMADDISALFGVLAGALEAGESGIAKCIALLTEFISTITARVPELPAAEVLKNSAEVARQRLAAAYPPAARAFARSWERPNNEEPNAQSNKINCKISAKVEERRRAREEAKRVETEREQARQEAERAERAERDATDREAAHRHMQRLKWSRARQLLNAVLKRSPGDAEARLLRIQCTAGAGDLEGAAREAEAWERELAASDAGTDSNLLARVQQERQKAEASMRSRRGAGGSGTEDEHEEHEGSDREEQASGASDEAERRQRAAEPQQPKHSQSEGTHVPRPTTSASAAPMVGPAVAADADAGPSRQPPCKLFARGSCTFGARCRFAHVASADEPVAPVDDFDTKEGECGICQEPLSARGGPATILSSCGHQESFCALCIGIWRAKRGAMPTCPMRCDPLAAIGGGAIAAAEISPTAGSSGLSSSAPAGPAVAPAAPAPSPPAPAASAAAAAASAPDPMQPAPASAPAPTHAASAPAPRPTRPYLPPGGPTVRPTRPYDPFNRGAGPSRPV